MSATTLLLAVTGGVFCGASLIGTVMIMLLWWQANQGKAATAVVQPARTSTPVSQPAMPDAALMTMPPVRAPHAPIIPVPPPVMADPSGVDRIWFDGIGGMIAGQRIMLNKAQVMIGRSGVCDVQLHDPKISRQHAVLRLQAGDYEIEDLRSTGGTYVNGRRISTYRLRDRDQVRLGDSILVFRQQ